MGRIGKPEWFGQDGCRLGIGQNPNISKSYVININQNEK